MRSSLLPLNVAVTPGDTKDFNVFKAKFVPELFEQTAVILGDGGYAEVGCFAACNEKEISLLTLITVKLGTSENRRDQAELLRDSEIQSVCARRTTVEPYQGQPKSLFGLENLPMKGLTNVQTRCTLSPFTARVLSTGCFKPRLKKTAPLPQSDTACSSINPCTLLL